MRQKCTVVMIITFLQAICFGVLRADINKDGQVDIFDLGILAEEWLLTESEDDMRLGAELLVNGTFDTDLTGWTLLGPPGNVIWDNGHVIGCMNQAVIDNISVREVLPAISNDYELSEAWGW